MCASMWLPQHRHDRRRYIQCYQDIVEHNRTESSYVLLGDAFLRIQMPGEATEAFEAALAMSPDNTELASKVRLCPCACVSVCVRVCA